MTYDNTIHLFYKKKIVWWEFFQFLNEIVGVVKIEIYFQGFLKQRNSYLSLFFCKN